MGEQTRPRRRPLVAEPLSERQALSAELSAATGAVVAALADERQARRDDIAKESAARRRAGRRQWAVILLVVLLGARQELVRLDGLQATCESTQNARQGIRGAFAVVIEDLTGDGDPTVGERLNGLLAVALPIPDC